jgi:glycosyltransferase involved in cell wall biosynthesis
MKVSIITVTYNSAETLANTIESVYQQTYQDIEYWIIDGASNDSTVDIIRGNVERFQGRLHYISEPDKGIFDAMNKGIQRCQGDIIGTLNADDYFTSDDIIEEVVKSFSKKDVDVVYGDIHFIHADKPGKVVRYYSSALFHPFWLRFGFMPAHPSLYVRREVYQEVGPYSLDFTIASDFDMMIRIFRLRKSRYAYLRKDFVTMRTGGISTRNLHNRLVITKEQTMACRKNGIYTNRLLISLKYFRKLLELRI